MEEELAKQERGAPLSEQEARRLEAARARVNAIKGAEAAQAAVGLGKTLFGVISRLNARAIFGAAELAIAPALP